MYTIFEYEYLRVEYKYEYTTLEIQSRGAHTATIGVTFIKTV